MAGEKIFRSNSAPRSTRGHSLRLSAVLTAILSLVAFILTLLAVISGVKKDVLEDTYSLRLNTTGISENIVKFTPTTSTSPSSSASTSDPLGALGSAFSGILNNITSGIDGAINGAESGVFDTIANALGVSEIYTFHLQNICQGKLADNAAGYTIANCSSYSDKTSALAKLAKTVPASTPIGPTTVSVPLIATISDAADYLNSISKSLSTTTFVFFILSLVVTGLSIPTSLVATFFPSSRLLIYVNLILTQLNILFHLVGSILVTILLIAVKSILKKLGDGLGIQAAAGGKFIAFVWVSAGLNALAAGYWFMIWFVEVRGWSYRGRRRKEEEIGNWRGIKKEVWADLRIPKDGEEVRRDRGFGSAVGIGGHVEIDGPYMRRGSYLIKV
ncbi:hypothetical protein ACMFMG_002381 [Clarireedia jacksonii]